MSKGKPTTGKSAGSQGPKVSLPIDGKTGMFLAQLIHQGLAKPKIDESLPDNEVQASIEQDADGKPNIVLHMKAAFFIVGGD